MTEHNENELKAFASEYSKNVMESELYPSVSAFMDFARIRWTLSISIGELDEAVENYDFEEWLLGGKNKDIAHAEICIGRAETAMKKLEEQAWKRVSDLTLKLSDEEILSIFNAPINFTDSFLKEVYDCLYELGEFPYCMPDAFKQYIEAINTVMEKHASMQEPQDV